MSQKTQCTIVAKVIHYHIVVNYKHTRGIQSFNWQPQYSQDNKTSINWQNEYNMLLSQIKHEFKIKNECNIWIKQSGVSNNQFDSDSLECAWDEVMNQQIVSLDVSIKKVYVGISNQCPYCNILFEQFEDGYKHISHCSQSNQVHAKCPICDHIFKGEFGLKQHMRTIHPNDFKNGKYTNNEYKKPVNHKDGQVTVFDCKKCKLYFKTQYAANKHQSHYHNQSNTNIKVDKDDDDDHDEPPKKKQRKDQTKQVTGYGVWFVNKCNGLEQKQLRQAHEILRIQWRKLPNWQQLFWTDIAEGASNKTYKQLILQTYRSLTLQIEKNKINHFHKHDHIIAFKQTKMKHWKHENTLAYHGAIQDFIKQNGETNEFSLIKIRNNNNNKPQYYQIHQVLQKYTISNKSDVAALNQQFGVKAQMDIPQFTVLSKYIGYECTSKEYKNYYQQQTPNNKLLHDKYTFILEFDNLFLPLNYTLPPHVQDGKIYVDPIALGKGRIKETNIIAFVNDCRTNMAINQLSNEDQNRYNCNFVECLIDGYPSLFLITFKTIKKNEPLWTYYCQ